MKNRINTIAKKNMEATLHYETVYAVYILHD